MRLNKEETKESDANFDCVSCDVEGEIRAPKDDVSLAVQ